MHPRFAFHYKTKNHGYNLPHISRDKLLGVHHVATKIKQNTNTNLMDVHYTTHRINLAMVVLH
jgi:hypothetical protein